MLQPSAQLTLGSTTQYPVVGHMVVQLTLCDAGRLLLPIRVSPSHGYTMAFRLQQGTFDLEGEAKREFVTCSKHLREGWAGDQGLRADTAITLCLSPFWRKTRPPKWTRWVCALRTWNSRPYFPSQDLGALMEGEEKPVEKKAQVPSTESYSQGFKNWDLSSPRQYSHSTNTF